MFIRIPTDLVDVNVHPQKAEVRFVHARAVSDALYSVLRAELEPALGLTRQAPPDAPARQSGPRQPPTHGVEPGAWVWPEQRGQSADTPQTREPTMRAADWTQPSSSSAEPARPRSEGGFIAELRGRFLLYDTATELRIVDRRTASILITAERLAKGLENGAIEAQLLLFPAVVPVAAPGWSAVQNAAPLIERLGFDLRVAGDQVVAAHAVPRLLATAPVEPLIAALLAAATQHSDEPSPEQLRKLLSTLAGLVVTTDSPITAAEAFRLGEELAKLEAAGKLPDRSPVLQCIRYAELEKRTAP